MSGNLEISTVVGCRMNCSYCCQDVHVKNYISHSRVTKMSYLDFFQYVSTVPKEVDIVFAGMAEPFLNEEAIDMILHAYWNGHTISLYTTGVGLTKFDISRLSEIKFNHFCLHLPDDSGKMKINVTVEYLNILQALMPLQKNMMCIGKLHPEVKCVTGDVSDGTKSLYSRGGNIMELAIPKKQGKLFCSACTEELNHNVLLPNGDVLLCCMDYAQQHVIGNLARQSYPSLFHSPEYKKVRAGLSGDESINILCRKCEVSTNVN